MTLISDDKRVSHMQLAVPDQTQATPHDVRDDAVQLARGAASHSSQPSHLISSQRPARAWAIANAMNSSPIEGEELSVRPAGKAGTWYIGKPAKLGHQLGGWLADVPDTVDGSSLPIPGARVIIAP
jgi:hypothetical protein